MSSRPAADQAPFPSFRPSSARAEQRTTEPEPGAGEPSASTGSGETPSRSWIDRFLRVPLFYKILIANAVILALVTGGGVWIAVRLGVSGNELSPWLLAGGAAGGGLVISAFLNVLILRRALAPISALERTAARIQAGTRPEAVQVPEQPLADRDQERLIRVFNDMVDTMARYRIRLRKLAVQALETAEGERRRVARELQDETAQQLASLLIRIQLVRQSADADERDRLLEKLRQEAADTLDTVRRVARDLHPPELDEIGVDRAVRAFVRGMKGDGGPQVRTELVSVEDCLGPEARLALYRILQEAVTNVYRHARAERAALRIVREEDQVVAEVVDDGIGFRVEAEPEDDEEPPLGLVGMRERALYVGGEVRIMSRPGAGTRVRVELPCDRSGPEVLPG